jgi:hypothetical protein
LLASDIAVDHLPADVALEVCRLGGWRLVCASYRGLQHVADGSPRQDAFALTYADAAINVAVADGLGSANLSHIGAQLACERGVRILAQAAPRARADFQKVYEQIQAEFFNNAKQAQAAPREFATTLQLLRIDRHGCWYARLGDGGGVLVDRNRVKWLGGSDRSDMGVSNLSDPTALSRLECDAFPASGVVAFLLFSDGLEDIFLDEDKQNAHEENVRKMIVLVQKNELRDLVRSINNFLSSDFGKDLKDDKTIIVGVLDHSELGPPLPVSRAPPPPSPQPVPVVSVPAASAARRKISLVEWATIAGGALAAILILVLAYKYAASQCFWVDARCHQPVAKAPAPAPAAAPDWDRLPVDE